MLQFWGIDTLAISYTPLRLQNIGVAEDVQSGKPKCSQREDYGDDGDGGHVDGQL